MLMAVTAYTDAQLLRDFRDLFRLTPEEAAATGISAETWLTIENGIKGEADRPGLEAKLKHCGRLWMWSVRCPTRPRARGRSLLCPTIRGRARAT